MALTLEHLLCNINYNDNRYSKSIPNINNQNTFLSSIRVTIHSYIYLGRSTTQRHAYTAPKSSQNYSLNCDTPA